MKNLKVAILGSGNIATDLLIKALKSTFLKPVIMIGRHESSTGLKIAKNFGLKTSTTGIECLVNNRNNYDIIFDATSAEAHMSNAQELTKLNKIIVDLTPSHCGDFCIPSVNAKQCLDSKNINMVTCGGQAAIPIINDMALIHNEIEYIEMVTSIASLSAGAATRGNLDNYIHTTEDAIYKFSKPNQMKTIINLNPALPCIKMQVTIFAKIVHKKLKLLEQKINKTVALMQSFVPGYHLNFGPIVKDNHIIVSISITGSGDFLPKYAGNLDIITCASINMAESYARH